MYLTALWATPAILLYVSQRKPFNGDLANLLWWAGTSIAIYILVPVIYARTFGQSVRGYGLSVSFVRTEGILIALIAGLMVEGQHANPPPPREQPRVDKLKQEIMRKQQPAAASALGGLRG